MIRTLPLFAVTLTLAVAAPASAGDARIVQRLYNPDAVVRVDGRLNVQASIAFEDDEHIENVAIGDSASWQVTPNKRANLLFVKPLNPRARTNMTVVTDKRTYFFDLVTSATANPLYVLRFTYPAEPKKALPQQTAAQGMSPDEAAALTSEKPLDPANLNFAWKTTGKPNLLPSRIYDDGNSTFVTWNAGRPVPAILIKNEKGDEGPVNYAVRGDVIVIEGVPGQILLRSGKDAALLEYQGTPRQPASPAPNAALAAADQAKGQ
jgi:type IV secretion system protein VirB9